MSVDAQKEMLRAEAGMFKAEDVKEFGRYMVRYINAHMDALDSFPSLTDSQKRFWRLVKKHTGQTSLRVLVVENLDDPDFKVMITKDTQGKSFLVPDVYKGDESVDKLDTEEVPDNIEVSHLGTEGVDKIDDSEWEGIL